MLKRRVLRVLASIGGGIALWLSFPDYNLWWLAPIGVAAINLSVLRIRAKAAAGLGLLAGWAFFIPTLAWSGVYVGTPPWFALATLEALYFAAMAASLALAQRRHVSILIAAAIWVVQEWLRSTTPFGGFPWARIAFSQADAVWTPIVAWVGAPGLTFLVAGLGGLIALAASVAWSRRQHTPELIPRPVAFAGLVPVLALLAGTLMTPPTDGRPLKVSAVQGNVPTAGLDFNAEREAVLRNHLRGVDELTTQVKAGKAQKPDVIVLPENASDIDPLVNLDAGAAIQNAANAAGSPLIIGTVLQGPGRFVSNTSLLYRPGVGITDRYTKQHPVPFGEYIPYRSFFRTFSSKVDLVRKDFAAGQRVGVFSVPTAAGNVKLAPIICFEVAYDDLMRKPAERGAQIFAVQTNNATFGYTAESTQQLAISRVRALEYGRSVVHVSTVGVSALITPDGVAHESSELFTHQVLNGSLPLRDQATLAQKLGRFPEILCACVTALVLAGAARENRRLRKSSAALVR